MNMMTTKSLLTDPGLDRATKLRNLRDFIHAREPDSIDLNVLWEENRIVGSFGMASASCKSVGCIMGWALQLFGDELPQQTTTELCRYLDIGNHDSLWLFSCRGTHVDYVVLGGHFLQDKGLALARLDYALQKDANGTLGHFVPNEKNRWEVRLFQGQQFLCEVP